MTTDSIRGATDGRRGRVALLTGHLGEKHVWQLAIVVGTLINIYGQIIVPILRGVPDPFRALAQEVVTRPGLSALSIGLGFLFPLFVAGFTSMRAHERSQRLRQRAWFPDLKPDPVFRADREGNIVDMGEVTSALFEEHGIRTALDVLGEERWRGIWDTVRDGRAMTFPDPVQFAGTPCAVAHSLAPDGTVNIYLNLLPAACRDEVPDDQSADRRR